MAQQYDFIVIGAGPGGYEAAIRAAQNGLKTAVIESREAGGTCLNRGCIPTKSLLHSSGLYREMKESGLFGVHAEEVTYNLEEIYERKNQVTAQLKSGVEMLLNANRIDFIRGRGKITGEHEVTAVTADGEKELSAANILIATGSIPAVPKIKGADLLGVLTSDELLSAPPQNCKKLVIIGGGVIGIEFATIFNSLGVEVCIIEAMDRILPSMDRELSQNTRMILKKRGVEILTSAIVEEIAGGNKEFPLNCLVISKDQQVTISGDYILVAAGRRAYTEGLFGEEFSLETENGGIVVNADYQTSVPSIYAIGDVVHGSIQLAHAASAQGLNAVAHICSLPQEHDLEYIPSCIYTNPEIASVGLTADEAKAQGIRVKVGKYTTASNGKSLIEAKERGLIKLVFDEKTEILLGAQIMCSRATDFINELTSAVVNKLTLDKLVSVIRPHPTFAEGVTEAVEAVKARGIHSMPKKGR